MKFYRNKPMPQNKNGKQSTRNMYIDGCIEHDAYNAYEKKDRRKRIE